MSAFTSWIGVDPGAGGAIAVINCLGEVTITDMPDTPKGIYSTLASQGDCHLAIEEQGPRDGQSSKAGFTHARDYGIVLGILTALQIPYETIRPQVWKRQLRIPAATGETAAAKYKDGKAKSMKVAEAMFPTAQLRGPRGGALDGRADALLIAEAVRQIRTGK